MGIVAAKAFVRSEFAEMKSASEGRTPEDLAAQAQEDLNLLENIKLNIAITGAAGVGKSSLVNALLGVADDDEGAAKTGVVETTVEPVKYTHPEFTNVAVWDLPGIGTTQFNAEAYLERVNFSQYDFFLIVSRDRFTENDVNLARDILRMQKTFYFVRTQIDVSLESERRKRGFNEKATLDQIRNYCVENLWEAGMPSTKVFLISSWYVEKYDFPRLLEALMSDMKDLKTQVLAMTLAAFSKDGLAMKKAAMEHLIRKQALTSCAIGAIPVPGLSFACDVVLLVGAMQEFCRVFGLDEGTLRKLAEAVGLHVSELQVVIKKSPQSGKINAEFVVDRLRRAALCTAVRGLESALGFVPVLGSLTGAGLSFATTFYMLKSFLNDVVEDAENVRAKVAELSKDRGVHLPDPFRLPPALSPHSHCPIPLPFYTEKRIYKQKA